MVQAACRLYYDFPAKTNAYTVFTKIELDMQSRDGVQTLPEPLTAKQPILGTPSLVGWPKGEVNRQDLADRWLARASQCA